MKSVGSGWLTSISVRGIGYATLLGASLVSNEALAAGSSVQFPVRWWFILVVGLAIGAVVTTAIAYYVFNRPSSVIKYSVDEQKIFSATTQIAMSISIFAVCGVITTLIACLGVGSTLSETALAFGVDMLVSAAAGALGALFGFVFGIPRTPDPATRAAVVATEGEGSRKVASTAALGTNTNLERVSDWLTTLLIGATLVQLKEVPGWITGLAHYVGDGGLTNTKIIPFVAVFSFVLGFLGVYLITRLFLTAALLQMISLHAGGEESSLSVLRAKLSDAAKSTSPDDLSSALAFYGNWPLQVEQKANPELSADLARVLAKYLSTGKAEDVTRRLNELKAAVSNAAADPTEKDQLRKAFNDKSVTTGDSARDGELLKLLA